MGKGNINMQDQDTQTDVQESSAPQQALSISEILSKYSPAQEVEEEIEFTQEDLESLGDEVLESLLADVELTAEELAELDEELSPADRAKRARTIKMNKARLKIGQALAKRRLASGKVIQKRAMRRARATVLKKMLKNRSKDDLSYSARAGYEKMLAKKKPMIVRLAKKKKKEVRRDDINKFK